MLLPNQCSFCAHQRIHTHKSPYCCPECGALCRSAYFQTHVKENCLHYARKVGYRWVLPSLLSRPVPPSGRSSSWASTCFSLGVVSRVLGPSLLRQARGWVGGRTCLFSREQEEQEGEE